MDQKNNSGLPNNFVTKDEFYKEMKELRKDNLTATRSLLDKQTKVEDKIIAELRRVSDEWKKDCEKDIKKVDVRVDKLESKIQKENILASIIAGASAVLVTWLSGLGGK
jgi:hypothetical protein